MCDIPAARNEPPHTKTARHARPGVVQIAHSHNSTIIFAFARKTPDETPATPQAVHILIHRANIIRSMTDFASGSGAARRPTPPHPPVQRLWLHAAGRIKSLRRTAAPTRKRYPISNTRERMHVICRVSASSLYLIRMFCSFSRVRAWALCAIAQVLKIN